MANIELEAHAVPQWIDISPYIPNVEEKNRIRTCVVLGSFGKFHKQINETIKTFEQEGITVLAPKHSKITGYSDVGFELLESDDQVIADLKNKYPFVNWTTDHSAAVLERIFLNTIDQAGFIYIVDPYNVSAPDGSLFPNGYVGNMVAQEIGRSMASKKPIYASHPLNPSLDEKIGIEWPPHWNSISKKIKTYSPDEIITMVNEEKLDEEDYDWCPGYIWKWGEN